LGLVDSQLTFLFPHDVHTLNKTIYLKRSSYVAGYDANWLTVRAVRHSLWQNQPYVRNMAVVQEYDP